MLNLNMPINEVINEYPITRDFLEKNEIFCVDCSVGTCLLKDLFEIHNFSSGDQIAMFENLNDLVTQKTKEIKVFTPLTKKDKYSAIVEMLIEEHRKITELVYIAEYIIRQPNFLIKYAQEVEKLLYFFKYYADDFHHGKEEDMLFYLFEKNDILKAMYQEHEQSREYRSKLVSSSDVKEISQLITEYCLMLKDHIYKEDNILFPYLDRNLTTEMLVEIDRKMQDLDLSINDDVINFIEDFNNKEFSF
ncbi:hemerythrin domain-containing protein [Erysipelotrichaceae bacterium OttesenSCG-928-M19]|nr:hemerythrin domain-containing protein [Erysipelotrichaceae bacterium OttesenSCG-928-M19]